MWRAYGIDEHDVEVRAELCEWVLPRIDREVPAPSATRGRTHWRGGSLPEQRRLELLQALQAGVAGPHVLAGIADGVLGPLPRVDKVLRVIVVRVCRLRALWSVSWGRAVWATLRKTDESL